VDQVFELDMHRQVFVDSHGDCPYERQMVEHELIAADQIADRGGHCGKSG
jgi:hypothetical protein